MQTINCSESREYQVNTTMEDLKRNKFSRNTIAITRNNILKAERTSAMKSKNSAIIKFLKKNLSFSSSERVSIGDSYQHFLKRKKICAPYFSQFWAAQITQCLSDAHTFTMAAGLGCAHWPFFLHFPLQRAYISIPFKEQETLFLSISLQMNLWNSKIFLFSPIL